MWFISYICQDLHHYFINCTSEWMLWHLQTIEFSICLHSGQLRAWKVKLGRETAWCLMEIWCSYTELCICNGTGRGCLREGQFKDNLIVGPLSGFQVQRNAATGQKVVTTEDRRAKGCVMWVKARHYGALGKAVVGLMGSHLGVSALDWQPNFIILSTI